MFFKPKWKHKKADKRLESIYKIKDDNLLIEIIQEDDNYDVKLKAFDQLLNKTDFGYEENINKNLSKTLKIFKDLSSQSTSEQLCLIIPFVFRKKNKIEQAIEDCIVQNALKIKKIGEGIEPYDIVDDYYDKELEDSKICNIYKNLDEKLKTKRITIKLLNHCDFNDLPLFYNYVPKAILNQEIIKNFIICSKLDNYYIEDEYLTDDVFIHSIININALITYSMLSMIPIRFWSNNLIIEAIKKSSFLEANDILNFAKKNKIEMNLNVINPIIDKLKKDHEELLLKSELKQLEEDKKVQSELVKKEIFYKKVEKHCTTEEFELFKSKDKIKNDLKEIHVRYEQMINMPDAQIRFSTYHDLKDYCWKHSNMDKTIELEILLEKVELLEQKINSK